MPAIASLLFVDGSAGVPSSQADFSDNGWLESSYRGLRFPPEIISHAIRLQHRLTLSLRDVEDLPAERGVTVSYEAIRCWCIKFGPTCARSLRRKQGLFGDIWRVDEVFITMRGERH